MDLIVTIRTHHRSYLDLCDQLELIADSLPDRIDVANCEAAIDVLLNWAREHHRFEETNLFPLLRHRAPSDQHLHDCLDRLENEHHTDQGYADEIVELLSTFALGSYQGSAETAGYMLRGMFESMRRHIGLENDFLLPIADRLLNQVDRVFLASILDDLNPPPRPEADRYPEPPRSEGS